MKPILWAGAGLVTEALYYRCDGLKVFYIYLGMQGIMGHIFDFV